MILSRFLLYLFVYDYAYVCARLLLSFAGSIVVGETWTGDGAAHHEALPKSRPRFLRSGRGRTENPETRNEPRPENSVHANYFLPEPARRNSPRKQCRVKISPTRIYRFRTPDKVVLIGPRQTRTKRLIIIHNEKR